MKIVRLKPNAATPATSEVAPVAANAAEATDLQAAETEDVALPAKGGVTNAIMRAFTNQTDGLRKLDSLADFEQLARVNHRPGARGAKEVKFLIVGVDTGDPQLYFINGSRHGYHYDFFSGALGHAIDNEQFSMETYFRDDRKNLAGTLVLHDDFDLNGEKGLLALEFWPTDPVKAKLVAKAFDLISSNCPAFAKRLRYHPAGNTQEQLFKREGSQFDTLGVRAVSSAELFKNQKFQTMNPGEGFGLLRVIDPSQPSKRPPSIRDVVIFKSIPNDLSHTGGVITEAPQTNLSHVNLKAVQNGTPNAFIKDASTDPKIAPLIGKIVRYEVTESGYELRQATQAEADAFLESQRPQKITVLTRDLTQTTIKPLARLRNGDTVAYGAKSANIGELNRILPNGTVPKGFGIPFSFYDRFMKETGLYDEAQQMMAEPDFQNDVAEREQLLERFRRKVRRTDIPQALADELVELQAKFPAGTSIRCRSSTNNEDMEGFNGAGLYDSYTHRPDEGQLGETVKQVWSSLWNFRAYEEREFYRIDHMSAAMAVAVHPNFDDEQVNGVAVTKNIYDPEWRGFYVNAQAGENLVTNPDPGATPDELLISAIGPNLEWETQYLQHSSLVDDDKTLMSEEQVERLTEAMDRIQKHFALIYNRVDDKNFAMDIEFKFAKDGALVVKQARPWVDPR